VGAAATRPAEPGSAGLVLTDPAPGPSRRSSLRIAGWVATGVLAAGAVAAGVLALRESGNLETERNRYLDDGMNPGYAADKAARLDRLATRTRNFSILADSLGAAAVIVGAVTLFTGLVSGEESGARQVGLGPSGLRVTF